MHVGTAVFGVVYESGDDQVRFRRHETGKCVCASRPWRIMLKNCPIMLCSNALKCFNYASKNCY